MVDAVGEDRLTGWSAIDDVPTALDEDDDRPFAQRHFALVIALTAAALAVLLILHLGLGRVSLTPAEVLAALTGDPVEESHRQIVTGLRQPRGLIALTAGAMLGLAGALLQTITRNPLAEPGLLGVSAGGVFAVTAVLALTGPGALPGVGILAVAAAGSLASGGLVYWLGWRGTGDPLRLVLDGVLVAAVLGAATSLVLLLDGELFGAVLRWVIGSLHARVWTDWAVLWPWAAAVLPLALLAVRTATVLHLGEDIAAGLGVPVGRARLRLFTVAALLTAGAVAVVGAVGFIGLIGPHLARRVAGGHPARVLPLGMLFGAALLLGADVIAEAVTLVVPVRGLQNRSSLPVGAVTALLGGPLLLALVLRERRW